MITPDELGFESISPAGSEALAWTRMIRGQRVVFRALRSMEEVVLAERLQQEVMALSELDTVGATALIAVNETGGEVIGAFVETSAGEVAAGVCVGYGGYHHHIPRLLSDFLAVDPQFRSLGVGTEMKRLQAGLALERGFEMITWTVDPLRAANARMNFEKLGAHSRHYEIDRYRSTFGEGFYGGLPTDRLHINWSIASTRVQRRLLGTDALPDHQPDARLPQFDAAHWSGGSALVSIPADIDDLVQQNPASAMNWRLATRNSLQEAFSCGLAVTGFIDAVKLGGDVPALLLEPWVQVAVMLAEEERR